MSQQPSKQQRTQPSYELLYHPGIPGRGEFIRLAFEATKTPYTDIANEDPKNGYAEVQRTCMNNDEISLDDGNPPVFSPPALRVKYGNNDGGKGKTTLIISQTPNILIYLGDKLGLAGKGEDEGEKFWIQQLTMTALDLNNEIHDTHHPIAVMQYYEDQKDESLKKAKDVRENRIPKFLSYFSRTLKWNSTSKSNDGQQHKYKYLLGDGLTIADITVWQVLDGLKFAFPKEMEARKEEFPELLGKFYEGLKEGEELKGYLGSSRRLKYSQGVFRYYPELDRQ